MSETPDRPGQVGFGGVETVGTVGTDGDHHGLLGRDAFARPPKFGGWLIETGVPGSTQWVPSAQRL